MPKIHPARKSTSVSGRGDKYMPTLLRTALEGFEYAVSITGTTGKNVAVPDDVLKYMERMGKLSKVPVRRLRHPQQRTAKPYDRPCGRRGRRLGTGSSVEAGEDAGGVVEGLRK